MARWRLDEPHYINACPPDLEAVEWEYKETDRQTGRERRKRYQVPMYCEKETIVARQDSAREGDFIYNGDPTPAMQPLDDEARQISEALSQTWVKPPDFEFGQNNFNERLLDMLEKRFSAAAAGQPAEPVVLDGVSRKEFEALQRQLEQLMVQNSELNEKLGLKSEKPGRKGL